MLTLRRAAILLLLLSTLSARRAQATWQGGAGFYVGFNSQVVDPSRLTDPTQGFGRRAVTAAFTPFVVWNGEYGRITAYVRLQGEVTGFLLVPFGLLGAYRGTLVTRLDAQLSETRTWSLALSGRGGSFNGGLSSSDPDGVPLEGLNIPATNFLSVDGRSLFSFKETPRVEISQQTVFRTFIPYSLFAPSPGAPPTGPSYTVDAQGIASYYWQRFSLGGDLLVGWFLPPPRRRWQPVQCRRPLAHHPALRGPCQRRSGAPPERPGPGRVVVDHPDRGLLLAEQHGGEPSGPGELAEAVHAA